MVNMDKFVRNNEDREKLEYLKNNKGQLRLWLKFYNKMCVNCRITQIKLQSRGKGITEDKLCSSCRDKLYEVFR